MKRIAILSSLMFLMLSTMTTVLHAQDIVFDQQITWNWETSGNPYGGYGFYWWHTKSHPNYGELSSTDWTSPNNYADGEFRMRIEVISQPSSTPFYVQLGIWQDEGELPHHSETVASRKEVSGGAGSVYEGSLGSPRSWWDHPEGDLVDFTRPEDFYRIGIVLWNKSPLCIPMGHDWNPSGCPEFKDNFFPMEVRVTITAYPSGTTPPPPPPPPGDNPDYSINFDLERTNEQVSSDHEYSFNNWATVISGSNDYVDLTPGTDVRFRDKSDNDLNQTLTVPDRPVAPFMGIDYANQRTSDAVGSELEYSGNANMSGATTGSGGFVDLTPGSTTYFRTLHTSNSFRSDIYALYYPTEDPPEDPPNYSVNFASESTNEPVSSLHEYSTDGWASSTSGSDAPIALTPGTDVKFRSISYPTLAMTMDVPSRPSEPTFTLDEDNNRTGETVGSEYIYGTMPDLSDAVNGSDDYVPISEGTSLYIAMEHTANAFRSSIQELVYPYNPDPNEPPSYEVDFILERTNFPVSNVHAYSYDNFATYDYGKNEFIDLEPGQVIYFRVNTNWSLTQTLDVPERPAAPSFGIDYGNETTDASVSSAFAWSTNSDMSNASDGTGAPADLLPGTTMYFRQKAAQGSNFASGIQSLSIPDRPAAPSFAIDFENERTTAAVGNEYEVDSQADMSSASSGTGDFITCVPGENLYIRMKATASTFKSATQQLPVPDRPAAPAFSIDYMNERTAEMVDMQHEYSVNGDMSSAISGSGSHVDLVPGEDLYVRQKANPAAFSSEIQNLDVPERPDGPVIEIDFEQEQSLQPIDNTTDMSANADMSGATTGAGLHLELEPGDVFYFRSHGTSEAFESKISMLEAPDRPAAPEFAIDFLAEQTATGIGNAYLYASQADMSDAATGNGSQVTVTPGSELHIQQKASPTAFASHIQLILLPERPAAPNVGLDYLNEMTNMNIGDHMEYSTLNTFNPGTSGSGDRLPFGPGMQLYFRYKGTESKFASEVQELRSPARPVVVYDEGDTTEKNPFDVKIIFFQEALDMSPAGLSVSNGSLSAFQMVSAEEGSTVYQASINANAPGMVGLQVMANASAAGSYQSESLEVYYKKGTGVSDQALAKALQVFPNPSQGQIRVKSTLFAEGDALIQIYSLTGKLAHSVIHEFGTPECRLELDHLKNGVYFIRISNGAERQSMKLIMKD